MLYTARQRRVYQVSVRAEQRRAGTRRHKCFISYHQEDADEVCKFIDDHSNVLIAKVLGVSDDDDFIDSSNTDYVMRRIREKYLTDSTVTIVLLGKCTWARKYVDWEVAATLRNDPKNKRSGLLGVTLPSAGSTPKHPERLEDNLPRSDGSDGYARWIKYPAYPFTLKRWIEDAFGARNNSSRYNVLNNTRPLFKYNRHCA